jgi:hypothetical protein
MKGNKRMNTSKCSSCGREATAGINFCGTCGSKVIFEQEAYEVTVIDEPGPGLFEEAVPYAEAPYNAQPYSETPYNAQPYSETPYAAQPYSETPYTAPTYSEAPHAAPTYSETPYTAPTYAETPYTAMPRPANTQPSKLKTFFSLKKLILIGAAAAVLIAGIILFINITSSNKYEQAVSYIHFAQNEDRITVVPRGKASFGLDGYIVDISRSLDGATAIITVHEQSFRSGSEGDLLYLITDSAQLISDGVLSAWISASGNAVIYCKEFDSSNATAELWQYIGGNHTRIINEFNTNGNCVVSPDGRTVAFSARDDRDRETGYYWDGKLTELGRDIMPIAVSDGARYIYYIRDNVFFVQRGANSDNRERLGDASDIGYIYANRDLSQIIYNAGSRSYISSRGDGRESLSGSIVTILAPEGTGVMFQRDSFRIYRSPWFYICDISDFGDTFYLDNDYNIIRIDARFETSNITRSVDDASLARDGRTITYLRNSSIYQINGLVQGAEAVELVRGDVQRFEATSDGNAVFYVNDINELFYQRGTRSPVVVSSYISGGGRGFYYMTMFNGQTLFYVSDDELFSSTGERGQIAHRFDGRVTGLGSNGLVIFAEVTDRGEILTYISEDGKAFTQLD